MSEQLERTQAYKYVQFGDPRLEVNRRRRLDQLRIFAKHRGPIDATQRQVDADPVLRSLLEEGGVNVVIAHHPPYQTKPRKTPATEREVAVLRELNDSARVLGDWDWIICVDQVSVGGSRYPRWHLFSHRNQLSPTRGAFNTRDALLDDFDADKVAYLEWAADRGI